MIANRLAASIARSSFRAFFRQASHQVSFSARLQGLGRYFSSNADHGKGHHHKHESKGKDDHVHGKDCNHPEVDKDGKPHVHGPDCQHDHHHHHGDGHVHGPDCNHDHDHDHHHENAEDTDPTLLTITEFKNALELLQKGELMQGYERLKQVRDILENVKMHETLAYFRLLRKLAVVSLTLNHFQDCEEYLLKRVDLVQDLMTEEYAIYSCYNDLFAFYLRSNLEKAILLGKALESEEEQKSIPVYLQKMFLLNTGTAHLLAGNYLKAKSYLRECLKKDPNPQLKGMVLNNLALAYYWQKYSALDDPNRIKDFKKDAEENIEKELKTIVFMLKDSIRSLEDIDSIEETADKLFFANLLSHENKGFSHMNELQSMSYLSNSLSAYPILNIADFLLATDKAASHQADQVNGSSPTFGSFTC